VASSSGIEFTEAVGFVLIRQELIVGQGQQLNSRPATEQPVRQIYETGARAVDSAGWVPTRPNLYTFELTTTEASSDMPPRTKLIRVNKFLHFRVIDVALVDDGKAGANQGRN
jgi:hypothetical protein